MRKEVKAMLTLWRMGKINAKGLQKAVEKGTLTQEEANLIKAM